MVKTDYQTKYFDEKFLNLETGLGEIKSIIKQTAETATNAHKRIDAWENKLWGIAIGSGVGGGGIVAFLQHMFK